MIQGTNVDYKNDIPEPKILEPALNSASAPPAVMAEKLPRNDSTDDSAQGFSFSAPQTPSKLIELSSGNTMPMRKPNVNLEEAKGLIHRTRPKLSQQILNSPLLQNEKVLLVLEKLRSNADCILRYLHAGNARIDQIPMGRVNQKFVSVFTIR